MRAWMALLAVIPACGFHSSETKDGGDDGTPDASSRCFGSFVKVCFDSLADVPKMPLTLTDNPEIDTELPSPLCNQTNDKKTDYCIIAAAGFTLPTTKSIRGYGTRPLVLVSTTTITLEALSTVDVSSLRGNSRQGAGGNSSSCSTGTPPEMAGGGYGGSFGGKGGDGERLGGGPTAGHAAALGPAPTNLRGGCPGGAGDSSGGAGGMGGGAVMLIAAEIRVDGKINASGGAGSGGGTTKSGGGGAGSGGMIVLDAPSIMGAGVLFANGGGGGGGGAVTGAGDNGQESIGPTTAGLGGKNPVIGQDGGRGGDGSANARLGGDSGSNSQNLGGGGAGGGGAGFIRAHGLPATVTVAPPVTDQ
jgi:hypothetical protein